MTDPTTSPVVRAGAGRWTKSLLAVSLGLNLLIVGLAVGSMLRDGPPRGGRDFGLGPLSEALSRDDRKALRDAFLERHPDIRADRRDIRAQFDLLLSALRADPFDPAALDTALQAVARRNADLLVTGRELVAARLKAMTSDDRTAFADRLERGIRKLGRMSKDDK